jgi:two-component sensor histidine kinase
MRETTTAPLIAWSRAFPAVPQQAREARRFLAEILDDRPADDAILCLSELVANACLHSASAQHGGRLAVRVQLHGAHLRVEVRDEGGPWAESQREDAQGGRGLLIVDRLASAWGRSGNDETG